MYLINKDTNRIEKIKNRSFTDLGFREREHLQEWLANSPSALGEDLLIIQKEFSGFDETNERLDLLAIDKEGNLVIIENKLDDSGKNVTWQCLKYASYCSSLKKSQIVEIFQSYLDKNNLTERAEDLICEFLEADEIDEVELNTGYSQRLIFVSGSYRKEVTSTVIWLLNYGLSIQCFQVAPYELNNQLFLNIEQIIPVKEAEEFSISIAEKSKETVLQQKSNKNRHKNRLEYWSKLLEVINTKTDQFNNISPSKNSYIGTSTGVRGVGYFFVAGKKYGSVEIYIDRGEASENKKIFDIFFESKDQIESDFGETILWERLDDKRASRLKFKDNTFSIDKKDEWSTKIEFFSNKMVDLISAVKPVVFKLKREL